MPSNLSSLIVPLRLVDRRPVVSMADLVSGLVPPPHFAAATFASYVPVMASQAAVVAELQLFAESLAPQRFRRRPPRFPGVYLDGEYGVGKTHLLAALWHAAPVPKAYCTFVGLTHLVGAVTFPATVTALSGHRLLCIDEFELDDPGDTVLVSSLLSRLVTAGVRLAVTSNTLPDALGEGRFDTADFRRDIQGLSSQFASLRLEGGDHRQSDLAVSALREPVAVSVDSFTDLLEHLASLHPSRYGALVDGLDLVRLEDVTPVHDQAAALRLVVLVDRLYDRDVAVSADGLGDVFPPELLAGGHRKKYLRALSRLAALTR